MKNLRIKTIIFVVILCMSIIFTACDKTENGATEAPTEKPDVTEAATVAETETPEVNPYEPVEGKKYSFEFTVYKTSPIPEDTDLLLYFEDLFNVDINIWNLEQSNYNELFNLKVVSGDIPDFITLIGEQSLIQDYYEQNVLLPLDRTVLDTVAPSVMAQLDSQIPGWEEHCTAKDGAITHIPNFGDRASEQAIIWRGDWLENVGITKTPETLEEWETALYAFAQDDPDGNGLDDTYGASMMVLQPVFGAFGGIPNITYGYDISFGNVWQIKDGEIVYSAVQEKMKEALEVLAKWYEDGVLDPEFVTGENQGGYWGFTQPFFNGRIGYTGQGAYYHYMPPLYDGQAGGKNYEEIKKINPEMADSLVFGEPPIGPYGDRGVSGSAKIQLGKGTAFGIQLADEPDKFGKLLSMINYCYENYENYSASWYGIEGKDYTAEEIEAYDGKTYNIPVWNATIQEEGFRTFFMRALTPFPGFYEGYVNDPAIAWTIDHNIGEHVYINALTTVLPSEEIYGTELEKITSEAYYQIITGEKPLDYFDEYVDLWWSSGGEVLQQEASEWYSGN